MSPRFRAIVPKKNGPPQEPRGFTGGNDPHEPRAAPWEGIQLAYNREKPPSLNPKENSTP